MKLPGVWEVTAAKPFGWWVVLLAQTPGSEDGWGVLLFMERLPVMHEFLELEMLDGVLQTLSSTRKLMLEMDLVTFVGG